MGDVDGVEAYLEAQVDEKVASKSSKVRTEEARDRDSRHRDEDRGGGRSRRSRCVISA
ncbi:hypothetical protein NGA_0425000 [Nannochloropsis gaditana CCMP526]|uniref:uncharacterized protein n=1 Tax=Nannochloropsis gaditana (strain CCMP526) TaxID=1093141 RepID=UPI00029F7A11|nr:hypothetical protein NGA_0425000 [Nannochloropsis gaditana CCMP526]EKU22603.1 hypothetical protein NGA_0425000 [Nannochloropsis gaditana CCMP526]|eukprot:XP_005853757.1 hypothetical protein NGA_0425000 [Nannochloropsis gaditana CCMP526]